MKTRNLSVAEYFDVIQKEYYIAEFRKKIYYNPKDKRYYGRVMDHKKQKIEDIASRNHFNDEEKAVAMRNSLFDELGRPKFEMSETDLNNYYSKGNEFSYLGGVWMLDSINEDGSLVLYSPQEEKFETVSRQDIIRIL